MAHPARPSATRKAASKEDELLGRIRNVPDAEAIKKCNQILDDTTISHSITKIASYLGGMQSYFPVMNELTRP